LSVSSDLRLLLAEASLSHDVVSPFGRVELIIERLELEGIDHLLLAEGQER
jgi:hypothetical protein